MMYVKKNSQNKIYLNTDKYEFYLLKATFKCEELIFICPNINFACDDPIIDIIDTDVVDVLNGMVDFTDLGYWDLTIYGNIDGANLDPLLATELLTTQIIVYK